MKKYVALRRSSQIFFFFLFVYILWSTTYPLTGLLPPETFFRTDPLLVLITAISERVFLPGITAAFIMLALALFLGRFFCGWVCPLGALSDLVRSFKKDKKSLNDKTNTKIRKTKYVILTAVVIAALFGLQFAWVMDPIVIMGRFVSLNLIPAITLLINSTMINMIKATNFYGPLYDFYRSLQGTLLGVQVHFFAHSFSSFLILAAICAAGLLLIRFWCRILCPLGATYGLMAKLSPFKRRVDETCIQCGMCKSFCRMGAIKEDVSYVKSECILCMDCVEDCPSGATRFGFKEKNKAGGTLTRKDFLMILASALVSFGFMKKSNWKGASRSSGRVLRPPGAQDEGIFQGLCVRCGNCMKVCPTSVLQPTAWESGAGGVWAPQLVPEIGYCEYNCNYCGKVCPTDAIPDLSLPDKQRAKIGLATVHRSICLAWHDKKQCIVCEEHCPVPTKAIKLTSEIVGGKTIYKPYIEKDLCIGCGICQNKCPVRPIRAIRVYPL